MSQEGETPTLTTNNEDSTSMPPPSTAATVGTCSTSNKRKSKPRSEVWDHFVKFEAKDGSLKARCNYCDREFYCDPKKNGTTSLRHYMNVCKKHLYRLESGQSQLNLQLGSKGHEVEGTLTTWKFDQEAARKALAHMIVVDELPFKFVDGEGFKYFISIVCPRFRIPSRWTVSRDCFEIFANEKKELKKLLENSCQRVCLTTDSWTSIQKINYMCLTAHFIDNDWKLNKRIINFCPLPSHKGEAISMEIEKCLHAWGIDKVFTITVDNASSNDVAIAKLKSKIAKWSSTILGGEHLHMRCVAHIINLIVVDGLREIGDSVKNVRNAVRYVRQSPARLAKFKECVEMEGISSKSLLALDVSTRCNSTYLMLKTAEKFERAFKRFDEQDPYFKLDLEYTELVDGVPKVMDERPTM